MDQVHKHVVLHEASKTPSGCSVLKATTLLNLSQFALSNSDVVLNHSCELFHQTYNAAYRNNGQHATSLGVVCKLMFHIIFTVASLASSSGPFRAIAVALFSCPLSTNRIVGGNYG
jgi:hypothetical protein